MHCGEYKINLMIFITFRGLAAFQICFWTRSPVSFLSRVMWALAVLAALALFVYVNFLNVKRFLSYPKAVNVEVNYKETLPFPAVTLCNYNHHTWVKRYDVCVIEHDEDHLNLKYKYYIDEVFCVWLFYYCCLFAIRYQSLNYATDNIDDNCKLFVRKPKHKVFRAMVPQIAHGFDVYRIELCLLSGYSIEFITLSSMQYVCIYWTKFYNRFQ